MTDESESRDELDLGHHFQPVLQVLGLAEGLFEDAPVDIVQCVRVEIVVRFLTPDCGFLLALQAQHLNEVEGITPGIDLAVGDAEGIGRILQASHRAGGLDPGGEGEDPRRVDENGGAIAFEVESMFAPLVLVQVEVADDPQRWAMIGQGDLAQGLEEFLIVLGLAGDPVSEAVSQLFVAPERAEVEKDLHRAQGLGVRVVDPMGEGLLPFFQTQAPIGIARHDVSGT